MKNAISQLIITDSTYDKDVQHEFARKLAADCIVLLQNDVEILPLQKDDKVAFIGELDETPRYQDDGSSHVNAYKIVTPLQAAKDNQQDISYEQGYRISDTASDAELENAAISTAKNSDKVIVFAGVLKRDESKGFDKKTIDLPDNQVALIKKLVTFNEYVIVVLQNEFSCYNTMVR